MPKDSAATDEDRAGQRRHRSKKSAGSNGIWNYAGLAVIVSVIGLATATLLLYWQLVVSVNEDHQQQQAEALKSTKCARW